MPTSLVDRSLEIAEGTLTPTKGTFKKGDSRSSKTVAGTHDAEVDFNKEVSAPSNHDGQMGIAPDVNYTGKHKTKK